MIYYTYAYLRKDKTPYYIGKGKGYRINSKQRNVNLPKNKSRIIFLKQNLTEEEAFRHEKYMIAVFGRKDLGTGILYNRTDGGDGTSGKILSEETKKRISQKAKGRKVAEKTKKLMSERSKGRVSYMKGKFHSEETKRKMSEMRKNKKHKSHTEETKKKISLSNKGKYTGQDNPMYGKIHTEETKNKMSLKAKNISRDKNLCLYEFLSPTGETIIEYTTIIDFAFKYNLRADCLGKIILGKRKSHKGWSAKKYYG
jgi:hypothetical protein